MNHVRFTATIILTILVTTYMVYDSVHKKNLQPSFRYTLTLH
jgi:hypothetical protein